jgi:hypothetical protein
MTPLYTSRQFGWKISLLMLPALIILAIVTMKDPAEAPPVWMWPLLLLIVTAFSGMTVTVTREHLRVSMLLGYPRKTIRIEDIREITPFEATGWQRFNARIKPAHGEFRLGGRVGVTVTPSKGLPLTVSDPDPKRLIKAVEKARARYDQVGGG